MDESSPTNQGVIEGEKVEKLEHELEDIEKKAAVPQSTPSPNPPAEPTSPPPVPPQPAPPSPPMEAAPQGTGRSKFVLWIGITLLVLALVATGAYYFGSRRTAPTVTPEPVPTQTPTPTPDPTANWEKYTNAKIGFSLRHPQTLSPSECKNGLHFFGAESGQEASEFCESPPFGKISIDYAQSPLISGFSKSLDFDVKEEQIAVAGLQATRQTVEKIKEAPGLDYTVYVTFSSGDYHYLISLRDEQLESIFDQILSTFKFLEATPEVSPTSTPSATITP